ncbi:MULTISPECIES: hypothetical protein [unclassified Rhizobium]|uniref:hypothetical protein n=1 Tax=Rhizobium TaxID=379 RepID=UPI0013AFE534|nr:MULTISPECIES: hypothetical protein [unclassified Rhizobium]QYA14811.1 hypothetical protein J5284_23445 [Rhizobium sp. AB2/73]UEQ83200.1 hypothetical protein I8E17_23705 [Rhizobium sp. AB2/73]
MQLHNERSFGKFRRFSKNISGKYFEFLPMSFVTAELALCLELSISAGGSEDMEMKYGCFPGDEERWSGGEIL